MGKAKTSKFLIPPLLKLRYRRQARSLLLSKENLRRLLNFYVSPKDSMVREEVIVRALNSSLKKKLTKFEAAATQV